MHPTVNRSRLFEFTDDELNAWTAFDQWDQVNRQSMSLDEARIPLRRPQGTTISIPGGCISDTDIFSADQTIALSRHPRYFTAVAHKHTFFEITMVCNGSCRLWIEDQVIIMQPGDICILPPQIQHAPESFSPSDTVLNLQIRQQTFQRLFGDVMEPNSRLASFYAHIFYDRPTKFLLIHTGDMPYFQDRLIEMYEKFLNPTPYTDKILSLYSGLFLAELLESYESTIEVYSIEEKQTNAVIVPILLYMQDHLKSITLEQLSQQFHYSVAQLNRMFHRYTGTTYSAMLHRFRMERAAQLLQTSDMPVADIARLSGFRNSSNFFRQFRQAYQTTPLAYRQTGKAGAGD